MIADLFGAGLDTTMTTLKWALIYLATFTEAQDNIRSEVMQKDQNYTDIFFLTERHLPITTVSMFTFDKSNLE